jgi:AraC family transcriptional regulator
VDSVTTPFPQDTHTLPSLFSSVDTHERAPLSGVSPAPPDRRQESALERLQNALADLLSAVNSAFLEQPEEAEGLVSQAVAHLRKQSGVGLATPTPAGARSAVQSGPRGGLAPWQIRRVASHVDTHLDAKIGTAELAALVELSVFHFCRAFRASLDESPHTYIMRRRIEHAQGMMLQTPMPLAQIAIACGLADQAHLNKTFRRFVGESPGAWRRARVTASLSTCKWKEQLNAKDRANYGKHTASP